MFIEYVNVFVGCIFFLCWFVFKLIESDYLKVEGSFKSREGLGDRLIVLFGDRVECVCVKFIL